MPRIKRGLIDGFIYHILNRGNGRQMVFHKERDYQVFVNLMRQGKKLHPLNILAYCLMPNHFHIVVKTIRAEELSRFMQWVMTSHVRRYHAHHKTSGHVWQGRFKSFAIQADEHLIMALRYVESNPIRAGLVKSAEGWGWSSHLERISRKKFTGILDELPIELPRNWYQYVDEPLTEKELYRIRQNVVRQSPYGSLEWRVKIVDELGIESTIRPRGRPKYVQEKQPVPFHS
jgi:putative transposase